MGANWGSVPQSSPQGTGKWSHHSWAPVIRPLPNTGPPWLEQGLARREGFRLLRAISGTSTWCTQLRHSWEEEEDVLCMLLGAVGRVEAGGSCALSMVGLRTAWSPTERLSGDTGVGGLRLHELPISSIPQG